MGKLAAIILMTFALGAQATEEERSAKVIKLLETQGMQATFDDQMRVREEYRKRSVQVMVDETLKRLKPNAVFRKKFNVAAMELFEALQPPWSSQEVVDIWAGIYGSKFSDEELDQLLAFYSSPVAQKEVYAGRESLMEFSQYLQMQYRPVEQRAVQQYVARMQLLRKECRCKK